MFHVTVLYATSVSLIILLRTSVAYYKPFLRKLINSISPSCAVCYAWPSAFAECRSFTRPQNPFASFDDETSPRSRCTRRALQRIILHGHRARCRESYGRHIEIKWSPKRQVVTVESPVDPELQILPLNLGEATSASVFNSLFPISVTRWGPRVALKYVIACTAGLNVACVPHTNRWQSSFCLSIPPLPLIYPGCMLGA